VIASAHLKSLLILVLAILLEVAGTTCMKLSNGFTKLVPSIAIFVLYGLSLSCFTVALKGLPLSVASAVWSGVGTSLVAIIGFAWFKEPVTFAKIAFIALILVGVIGLNLVLEDKVQ
jgi:small multidrug resistance pump